RGARDVPPDVPPRGDVVVVPRDEPPHRPAAGPGVLALPGRDPGCRLRHRRNARPTLRPRPGDRPGPPIPGPGLLPATGRAPRGAGLDHPAAVRRRVLRPGDVLRRAG